MDPVVRRWALACLAAEAVGMTAAAGSAQLSHALVGEPAGGRELAVALTVVVAGGLVEGLALGSAQVAAFRATHPSVPPVAYVAATLLVAGVGWAAVSTPAALAGPAGDGGSGPPQPLLVLGGAGLGVVMGAVLGGAQAVALRGAVARPGRWVVANAVAWVPAMAVIFAGASTPSADWSAGQVTLLGTVTGAVAGGVLGLVLGRWVPHLGSRPGREGPPPPRTAPLAARRPGRR
jgi:hypothetical protein